MSPEFQSDPVGGAATRDGLGRRAANSKGESRLQLAGLHRQAHLAKLLWSWKLNVL
jgi:hypothetical protein